MAPMWPRLKSGRWGLCLRACRLLQIQCAARTGSRARWVLFHAVSSASKFVSLAGWDSIPRCLLA